MKKLILLIFLFCASSCLCLAQILAKSAGPNAYSLTNASILVDTNDYLLVRKVAQFFSDDVQSITLKRLPVKNSLAQINRTVVIIGSTGKSSFIRELVQQKKISISNIENRWESYSIQTVKNPFKGVDQALVIVGSDRRGTAFGVFELTKQMGVSPWYWWADVPVTGRKEIFIQTNVKISDAPKVKYRGIFINDEAPALSNWSKEKFGGFNHLFYEKVFELMLRLKSNYLWPAMWGNAFYDDDSLNIKSADEYGIVIGTSHHEPLMRAHDEWRRYGKKQKWNYDSTGSGLREFWTEGMQRAWNEKIVSVGMRGDGDEPMSRETATSLLEKIVTDQRKIIASVTGKPAEETPQLWALYKEVQDYYDKGMKVPDDITLLLCDDNWGNIRKLPKLDEVPRKGGYGIYYHFDYVGGPRNYKWINTNTIARVWEQMHLAWEFNARQIWIVNVGDIKPMEIPISFFLDYAWNPEKTGEDDLQTYTEQWAAAQFGNTYAKQIAEIITLYTKYNARRKPELLDEKTYSLNFNEWGRVVHDYNNLLEKAELIDKKLPVAYKDAYFQLVLHPVKACANLNEMYYTVALNKKAYANKWEAANIYANKAKQLYIKDSLITTAYHQIKGGKWNHMMSQTHIGYKIWQQPAIQKIPDVRYVNADSVIRQDEEFLSDVMQAKVPDNIKVNIFYQDEERGVSIEADHFTKLINSNGISWRILPDHGKTGSSITAFPVTAKEQQPGGNAPHVEYEFFTYDKGNFTINAYFSPTLNFHSLANGLQYAISVDDETPQIISINKDDEISNSSIWNKWVAENIIRKTSKHNILQPGRHTVKYWMVNTGVVLQKLVLDFGDMKQSFLGPPETRHEK